jgi:hypothetical protein
MRERLPLFLVLAGTVTLVIGIIITVTLFLRRDNCDGISPSTVCQGYTTSIHWAYPIIVIGAGCFIAAGLSATNLVQRRKRDGGPVPRPEDREPSSH